MTKLFWKPIPIDFDQWDEPSTDPVRAAMDYLQSRTLDSPDLDDDCYDLRYDGRVIVHLEQCELTTDPMPEQGQFDGYEPGSEWYRLTGVTCQVVCTYHYELLD
jgi:hypothetical protein